MKKLLLLLFMKNISLQITVLAVILFSTGAVWAQLNRHVSKTYNFAFQIPKGSTKDPASTEKDFTYNEKSSTGASLGLIVDEEPDAASQISEALSSKIGKDEIVDEFIKSMKEDLKNAEFNVLERKDLRIGGMKSFKIVTSIAEPDYKMRNATFFIPVTAHDRVYIFTVTALDSDFDRWYKVAEASINSFVILKSK